MSKFDRLSTLSWAIWGMALCRVCSVMFKVVLQRAVALRKPQATATKAEQTLPL